MLRLPDHCRHLFRVPFGRLEPDIGAVVAELRETAVYTVGDIVTHNLLAHGVTPAVAVIDGHTMRKPCKRIPTVFPRVFRARNPAGTITPELTGALREAIASPPSLVVVEGEEDLAVIPLALEVPQGSVILYGQPGEGVVIRVIDDRAREDARRLLACFVPGP
ncbi:MAG: GTP-dependent dephospho-CoA kinase family protein [Methanolinea sp.]|nr:GTP-dependent dephospho-CoA kinase family protein [Methanolinea sp.]